LRPALVEDLAALAFLPALPALPLPVLLSPAPAPAVDRGLAVAFGRFVLAFAFTSAMTAFVSGDVARVAAFANLASPAR
jgi:hypothetical protein